MESPVDDVLSQIVVEEMVPVEQTLSTEPVRFLSTYIKFGNSGFRIRVGKECNNTFDFTPENKLIADDDKSGKYAMMLGSSLYELHNLINDDEKIKELEFEDSNLSKMSAFTNPVFIDALTKVFSRSGTDEIVKESNRSVVEIDLDKFKALKEDNPLIKYLKRVSEMSKGMNVIYFESKRK